MQVLIAAVLAFCLEYLITVGTRHVANASLWSVPFVVGYTWLAIRFIRYANNCRLELPLLAGTALGVTLGVLIP